MDIKDKPIPKLNDISGWKLVEISECGEKLVSFGSHEDVFILSPLFFARKIKGAIEKMYARKTVMDMLLKASVLLPDWWKFTILDAWRPIEVQTELFKSYMGKFRAENPKMSESELSLLTEKYCAIHSIDEKKPSPHNTGGAFDICITDANGNAIPMVSEANFQEELATRYYEEKLESGEVLTKEETEFLKNRRLLYHSLTSVGFSNYPHEWWHFDYGNQHWGKMTGNNAVYGMIKP